MQIQLNPVGYLVTTMIFWLNVWLPRIKVTFTDSGNVMLPSLGTIKVLVPVSYLMPAGNAAPSGRVTTNLLPLGSNSNL